jgi:hypothetical protein
MACRPTFLRGKRRWTFSREWGPDLRSGKGLCGPLSAYSIAGAKANTILLIQWTVASKVRDKAANDRSERLNPLEFKPDLTYALPHFRPATWEISMCLIAMMIYRS